MALIIGELRYSVIFLALTSVKDAYGSTTETYTEHSVLRASVKKNVGTKTIDNKEVFNTSTVVFQTHYRDSIESTMRIAFSGGHYRILDITEIGFKEGLSITAELINE